MSITGESCHPAETRYDEAEGVVYAYCELCWPHGPIQRFDPVSLRVEHLVDTPACHNVTFSPPEGVSLDAGLDADVWGGP